MTMVNGSMGFGAMAGAGFFWTASAVGSGRACLASCGDAFSGVPAAGASRESRRLIALPARGPVFMNGPASVGFGNDRGKAGQVVALVDRLIKIAATMTIVLPEDLIRPLGELVGSDPALYMTVAGRILRSAHECEAELASDVVGRLFDALYAHLPTRREPFAQAFIRRMHNLFASQGILSPNQLRMVKKMVEGRPEWTAEIVKYIRDASTPERGFRMKVAQNLDISLKEPVVVSWDEER